MFLINTYNPKMILPLLFVFSFSLINCSKEDTTQTPPTENVTLKQAEQIIFVQLLNSNDSGKIVYELPKKMKTGETVKAKGGDSTYIAQNNSWFFFINDHPELRWVHPCRYSFVSCSDGQNIIINERNEPENIDSLVIVNF